MGINTDQIPLSVLVVQKHFHRATPSPDRPLYQLASSVADQPPIQYPTIRALSTAPFVPSYISDASFLTCAEEFFEDNPLLAATLQPATQTKYAAALENFRSSRVANEFTDLSMDQRLSTYIQERYMENAKAGQRQEMSNLVCMLLLMYPNQRAEIGLARRCISGWKALKPSRSSAPFSKELVLALAWELIANRKIAAATVLLTSFAACLRVSEAIKLTWKRLALPGDVRLASYPPGTAGMNILDAKTARYTGKLQFVKLCDQHVIRFLSELKKSSSHLQGRIAFISYQQYNQALQRALETFGLGKAPFSSHSARIGKATEDFINGESVEQIAINGRWKSINSLRYYLTNGRAWLLNTPISGEKQASITQAADKIKHALRV